MLYGGELDGPVGDRVDMICLPAMNADWLVRCVHRKRKGQNLGRVMQERLSRPRSSTVQLRLVIFDLFFHSPSHIK